MGLLRASGLGVCMGWRLLSAQLSELHFSPHISDCFFFFWGGGGLNKGRKSHLMTAQSEHSGHMHMQRDALHASSR